MIPSWFKGDELPALCKKLGLTLHTRESHTFIDKGQPVIAIYERAPGNAHAEFARDLGPLQGKKLLAIIEIPKPTPSEDR